MSGHLLFLAREIWRIFYNTRFTLLPVLCCTAITQVGWSSIYDCQPTKNLFAGGSLKINLTLADAIQATETWEHVTDVWNDIVYWYGAPTVLAPFVGALVFFVVFHTDKMYQVWDAAMHIVVIFCVFGTIHYDNAAKMKLDSGVQLALATGVTLHYGACWLMVVYTDLAPSLCRWLYSVTNSAYLAIFLLAVLPERAVWFVLVAVAIFDVVSVRSRHGSPCSPAHSPSGEIGSPSEEIDDSIVTRDATRRLAAGRERVRQPTELARAAWTEAPWALLRQVGEEDSDEDYSESYSLSSLSSTSTYREHGWMDGLDELEERSSVGLSCLIFFTMLVGKSMAVGGVTHAAIATLYMISGLACIMSDKECALPVTASGLMCGMVGHFSWPLAVKIARPLASFV